MKPNKIVAAVLGFFVPVIGMLYVGKIGWAVGYIVAAALSLIAWFYFPDMVQVLHFGLVLGVIFACLAYRWAGRFPEGERRPAYSRWPVLTVVFLCLLLALLVMRVFAIEFFRTASDSMLPTIRAGAVLVTQKWGYGHYSAYGVTLLQTPISAPLRRGDIVVFERPGQTMVSRLIGLPGDKVAYLDKNLFINDHQVERYAEGSYFHRELFYTRSQYREFLDDGDYAILVDNKKTPSNLDSGFTFQDACTHDKRGMSCVVPAGHFFMLGDNRDGSYDSRMWGFIAAGQIVGKVICISP